MTELLLALVGGLAAGVTHVVLGADHVAAIAPFAIDARRGAWRVGIRWGVGHAAGIVVIASIARGLLDRSRIEAWDAWGGYLVGGVLMAVGAWGVWHARRYPLGTHDLERVETHAHVHTGASFLVGLVHGVAGTAAVLGVLPALGFSTGWLASAYLTGFGAGTVGAMTGVAAVLGLATGLSERRAAGWLRGLFLGASSLCLLLGVFWIFLATQGLELH